MSFLIFKIGLYSSLLQAKSSTFTVYPTRETNAMTNVYKYDRIFCVYLVGENLEYDEKHQEKVGNI